MADAPGEMPQSRLATLAAFSVHIFTACGAALALIAPVAAVDRNWPLMFGLLGLTMGTVGAGLLAYLTYVKFVYEEGIGNRPLLAVAILLMITGVQLVTVGLLAEMQARTYHESQDKPIYVIRRVLETIDGDGA